MTDAATTLERIESVVPDRTVRIEDLADRLGLRRAETGVFRKIYGLDELRYDPDSTLFDLALPPARRALEALPEGGRVRYVLYAHTIHTLTPAGLDPARVIRDELGLHDAEAFAIGQQACVSSMGAIDVAAQLLRAEADEDAHALVVAGERAFSPTVQLIPNTAIMAEAGGACLLRIGGRGDVVRSHATRTLGEYSAGLLLTKEETREYGLVYAETLGSVMRQALDGAGLTFADIELLIPHNVNLISWRNVIKELGLDAERVFLENVPRYSHCYASDIFLNYTTLRDAGRLVDGKHYLLVSVGLGATLGAMVITHRKR
ncbi:3-oxoacyl-ACP synthase III family protein [Streptomyces sp. NPDC053048]|uniref:3-oxoacyl-ACP synthase III family protein n=1 Tax=Streptomyces sp. NPDC053048 TaxID=3365694 RepID=UPI0037D8F177